MICFNSYSCVFPGADIFYRFFQKNGFLSNFLPFQQASEDDNILPARQEEPEESAAEKIYATLRECREQADPKKQKGTVLYILVDAKGREKVWMTFLHNVFALGMGKQMMKVFFMNSIKIIDFRTLKLGHFDEI